MPDTVLGAVDTAVTDQKNLWPHFLVVAEQKEATMGRETYKK